MGRPSRRARPSLPAHLLASVLGPAGADHAVCPLADDVRDLVARLAIEVKLPTQGRWGRPFVGGALQVLRLEVGDFVRHQDHLRRGQVLLKGRGRVGLVRADPAIAVALERPQHRRLHHRVGLYRRLHERRELGAL